jgi:hypothetical protein
MYGLNVSLLALTGLCAWALLRRRQAAALVPAFATALPLLLILAVPPQFHKGPRPLHDAVERLQVVRGALSRPGGVLVTSGFNNETCAYLATRYDRHCTSPLWADLKAQADRGQPMASVLRRAKATVIYADATLWAEPTMRTVLEAPSRAGWRQIAAGTDDSGRWSILVRRGAAPEALRRIPAALRNPDLVRSGIYRDGWLQRDALFVLAGGPAGTLVVKAYALALPKGN